MTRRSLIWIVGFVIFFMIAIVFAKNEHFEYPFSKEKAMWDISRGHVSLIRFGFSGLGPEAKELSSKYGFTEYCMGCEVHYTHGQKEYADLVDKWLEQRNGKDWQIRFYKQLDSLTLGQKQ